MTDQLIKYPNDDTKIPYHKWSQIMLYDNDCVSIIIYVYNPCLIVLNLCLDTHVIYISLIT
jgi:hypothetical protein